MTKKYENLAQRKRKRKRKMKSKSPTKKNYKKKNCLKKKL